MEVPCILENCRWKVRVGKSGFLTFKIFDMTNFPQMQMICFVLNCQRNLHIVFKNIIAGTMTRNHFKLRKVICALVWINCVNPRKATKLLIFGQINTLTIILHCSSTMVGGHNKQNNFNTATLSWASGVSAYWKCAPPLLNVSIDTPFVGVIEEQKQKNKHLQEQSAEFNCVR